MAEQEIKITIHELERMLKEQKQLVVDKLIGQSGYYNTESDAGNYRPLTIDKVKFTEEGLKSRFPDEFNTLKKYVR